MHIVIGRDHENRTADNPRAYLGCYSYEAWDVVTNSTNESGSVTLERQIAFMERLIAGFGENPVARAILASLESMRSPAHPSEAGELHELADRLNHTVIAVNPGYKGALDEINAALSTPPEADKKLAEDAARYRWLRDQPVTSSMRVEREDFNEDGSTDTWYTVVGRELDSYVDECIADQAIASQVAKP